MAGTNLRLALVHIGTPVQKSDFHLSTWTFPTPLHHKHCLALTIQLALFSTVRRVLAFLFFGDCPLTYDALPVVNFKRIKPSDTIVEDNFIDKLISILICSSTRKQNVTAPLWKKCSMLSFQAFIQMIQLCTCRAGNKFFKFIPLQIWN